MQRSIEIRQGGEVENVIPYGYCYCGCGEKTNLVQSSNANKGWVKGEPFKFISGHNSLGRTKNFCANGHERSPSNVTKTGHCKTCKQENNLRYSQTPECRDKQKIWIANNKDKIIQYKHANALKHSLKYKRNKNKNYHLQKETILLKVKIWKRSNPERVKLSQSKSNLRHRTILTNCYVADKMKVSIKDMLPELAEWLEIKRLTIQLQRSIKNGKN